MKTKSIMGLVLTKKIIRIRLVIGDMEGGLEQLGIRKIIA